MVTFQEVIPTAGLKSPPLIRKNTHALTAKENPKLKAIYINWDGSLGIPTTFSVVGGFAKGQPACLKMQRIEIESFPHILHW